MGGSRFLPLYMHGRVQDNRRALQRGRALKRGRTSRALIPGARFPGDARWRCWRHCHCRWPRARGWSSVLPRPEAPLAQTPIWRTQQSLHLAATPWEPPLKGGMTCSDDWAKYSWLSYYSWYSARHDLTDIKHSRAVQIETAVCSCGASQRGLKFVAW